jgi:hypothetical protein
MMGLDQTTRWRLCRGSFSHSVIFQSLHDGSWMTLVFFCSDIASASVPELVSAELAGLSEEVWKDHSWDWSFD